MHDHKHNHCEHSNLKFCAKCEVVHCLDCKKEWGKTVTYPHYVYPTTYPYRYDPWPVSVSTTTVTDTPTTYMLTVTCSHNT